MKPYFLTFEGIDGAGKSSHVPWLAELLKGKGIDVVVTREVGGTPAGEQIRKILLSEEILPQTEVLLAYAARVEHMHKVIQPALDAGKWVLSDRFADSTFAFQGAGRMFPTSDIEDLDLWCDTMRPDVTLFFDVPTQVSQQRLAAGRAQLDRIESMAESFHARVRQGYEMRVAHDPDRFVVLDGTQSIEVIRDRIAAMVESLTQPARPPVPGFFSRLFGGFAQPAGAGAASGAGSQ